METSCAAMAASGRAGTDHDPNSESTDYGSSTEWQHQLEVTFDKEASHRRRASVISSDDPDWQHGDSQRSNSATCFIHSLLGLPGDPLSQQSARSSSPVQSRLLTKKQLSDMAWNVRTLSKRLGSIKLKLNVKSIFLVTKQDQCLVRLTREVAQWLLSPEQEVQYDVYVEKRLESNDEFDTRSFYRECPSAEGRLRFMDLDDVQARSQIIDFVITMGGDGTVLYASWLFQRVVPPVLSFALGSLGFLTKFDFNDYRNVLKTAFFGGVTVSLRLRLECTVMRSKAPPDGVSTNHRDLVDELVGESSKHDITHAPEKTYQILNEIVVDRGPNPTMSSLDIFGDDQYFTSIQADGVCVATPTGSTAYNLAAGGSLCHPENPVILLTAICAHTLNFRPIILPDTIVMRVGVPYGARTSSWASFDGRERVELCPGDYVTITASRFPFANVLPGKHSHEWIQSISHTLNWNKRQKQKSIYEQEPQHP
ncbi:hypothetical protein VTO42DRAFT_6151 [Malbranchea cinnamomea]